MASGSEEGSRDADGDVDPSIFMTTDIQLLKQAWRNKKEETVEEYEGNGTVSLILSLYQMDLDRTQLL
ncbi:hypothetical protein FRX31_023417 [Thalictrum thalictroides]|uniref:Uncharacterized protein n=1 Tax=Thalictrum thalictroides TaxID=46969 RepID=A0A7J6VS38_THATH|nr:hypothetical protein FRX31_023417 [Thalictrum thalictroides]